MHKNDQVRLRTAGYNHEEFLVAPAKFIREALGTGRLSLVDNIAMTKVITARDALVDLANPSTSLGFEEWVEHLHSLLPLRKRRWY